jgi:hypothetical protein
MLSATAGITGEGVGVRAVHPVAAMMMRVSGR